LQILEIRGLVLPASFAEDVGDRVLPLRFPRAPFGDRAALLSQVSAAQVIREIRGGQAQELFD
jgi:hypothetical protein